ncbi:MAG: GHMP kinase, partial [Planctomycetes bacterium]|nr:GHMP kinase [Planctomycetota bacterium]
MDCLTVRVQAPARIHFGLLSFGDAGRQYGGVGLMIEEPAVRLALCPASRFELAGEVIQRVAECVRRWSDAHHLASLPACRLEVVAAPPEHVGLGSGTQLAYSVAAGLDALTGRGAPQPAELARTMGRGRRSAVGSYGFVLGGLIVDAGKLPEEPLSALAQRVEFPRDWRIVLVRPRDQHGLSGAEERRAFASVEAVEPRVRDQLNGEIHRHMIPALAARDCAAFGDSVYRYGRTAGGCFAAIQGGPYNGPHLTAIVDEIRGLGANGVGQSSWGPTLFAVVADQEAAD